MAGFLSEFRLERERAIKSEKGKKGPERGRKRARESEKERDNERKIGKVGKSCV